MKLVVVGGAPYADEYIRSVRRKGDPRVVFPGYVFGQRLLGAAAPRLRLLRADRGRRHAPGHPRGARRRQLRARQRPRAERRDRRRRRPDVLRRARASRRSPRSSSGSSTSPSSSRHYRGRARERARRYSWDAVTDEYEQLLQRRDRDGAAPARCRRSSSTRCSIEPSGRAQRTPPHAERPAARRPSPQCSRSAPLRAARARGRRRSRGPPLGSCTVRTARHACRRARGTARGRCCDLPVGRGAHEAPRRARRWRRGAVRGEEERQRVGVEATASPCRRASPGRSGSVSVTGSPSSSSRNWLERAHAAGCA